MFRGAITCIAVRAMDGTVCSVAVPRVPRERAAAEWPSSVALVQQLRDVPVVLTPSGAEAATLDGRSLDAEPGGQPAADSCVPMQSAQPDAAAAELAAHSAR